MMDEKICNKCHTVFSPSDHEQGVVINDTIFICEECHTKHNEECNDQEPLITKQIDGNQMPIALWLIQQQNKGKSFMSRKK